MAVIKTTTLGQARKSIGATNYYRRAGVQIARSKPTFAPGRTFSNLQLYQQKKMQLAQYMLLDMGGKVVADYANCRIKRLYSASSRYNRLVGSLVEAAFEGEEIVEYNPAGYWLEGGINRLGKWSVGNVAVQFSIDKASLKNGQYSVTIKFSSFALNLLFQQVNKRRSEKSEYWYDNIGICGFVGNDTSFAIIQPTFGFVRTNPSETTIEYDLSFTQSVSLLGAVTFDICFFVAYRYSLYTDPRETPIYGSSSVQFTNIQISQI